MAKYSIGRFEFKTKAAAFDEVKRIKNTGPLHAPLTGTDFEIIRSLVDMHDDAAQKLTGGCKDIAVLEYKEPGQYRPHRVFYIEHFDGSRTTFSIDRKCYGGLPPQVRMRDVIGQCCGASIRDIARDHKQRAFPEGRNSVFVCEATGATLSWDDAHVDHSGKWPISRIADEWINGKMPLSWELIVPGEFGAVLRPDIAEDFVKFHNDRAVLQVIHKTHNLSKGSGGYERKRSSTKLS